METLQLSVSDFIALTNQTLEFAYPSVAVEGEVASFKVNQGKYVFFDLKDETGTVGCFMSVWQLRVPIEDGMKVVVTAIPKLTQWGKFSLTVRAIRPLGDGALKKSFELLKIKLEKEGLFAPERKRSLPEYPKHVAVISSTAAAGYADFIRIAGDRWGGVTFTVANTQVQGAAAPDQMIRAIRYFNQQEEPAEVIVIVRGGGSADDLAAFNDEPLVRAVAESRIPILSGIGHEVDESLVDLAADVRAATPSNAAQRLVPDKADTKSRVLTTIDAALERLTNKIEREQLELSDAVMGALDSTDVEIERLLSDVAHISELAVQVDPGKALARGYAIIRGTRAVGEVLHIEEEHDIITAKVETYEKR